jgi:hypothetical protein
LDYLLFFTLLVIPVQPHHSHANLLHSRESGKRKAVKRFVGALRCLVELGKTAGWLPFLIVPVQLLHPREFR